MLSRWFNTVQSTPARVIPASLTSALATVMSYVGPALGPVTGFAVGPTMDQCQAASRRAATASAATSLELAQSGRTGR